MTLKIGDADLAAVYAGEEALVAVYHGEDLVWEADEGEPGGSDAEISIVGASSSTSYATSRSGTASIPLGVVAGDLLVASVMHRSALTTPEGWNLVDTQQCTGSGATDQWTSILWKRAAGTEGGGTQAFTQASTGRIGVHITVLRASTGLAAVLSSSKGAVNVTSTNTLPIPSVTGTAASQIALMAASSVAGAISDTGISVDSPWSLISTVSAANNRLGVAARSLGDTDVTAGNVTYSYDPTSTGIAAVTVLIGAESP